MKKQYIIALVIVLLAGGAFIFLRSSNKEDEAQRVKMEALEKLTEVAQKVPRAGLAQMGVALNRYYEKNKSYPAKLVDLYPDIIPNKAFIEEIDWEYEPKGNNFTLSKTIQYGGKQTVASIDKRLLPKMGTGTIAVAQKEPEKKPAQPEEETSLASLTPLQPLEPLEPMTSEQQPEELLKQPEITSVVKGKIGKGIPDDVGRAFLVWKDADGVLGFGNVKYPERRDLTIYNDGRWLSIRSPALSPQEKPVEPIESLTQSKTLADVANEYCGQYLVWKDKRGRIGYGNVEYPPLKDLDYICVNGNWQKVVN